MSKIGIYLYHLYILFSIRSNIERMQVRQFSLETCR